MEADPKLGVTRKVVVPPELYADLKTVAALMGVPVAEVMRASYAHYTQRVLRRRGAA